MSENIFEKGRQLSEEQLQFAQLREDRLFDKIPKQDYALILDNTTEYAKKQAKELLEKYPLSSIEEIVQSLSLKLSYEELPLAKEFMSVGYFELPNKIVVNEALKENDAFFKKMNLDELTFDSASKIIIAHELFHYLQTEDTNCFINSYEVVLWKLGKYKHRSKVSSLAEIGAMVFAKELLNLEFYPAFFELLLTYPYFPKEIGQKLEAIYSN